MRSLFFALLIPLLCLGSASQGLSQTATDLNEGLQVNDDPDTPGLFVLSWWGKANRTYFIQQSEDLRNWNYVPVIESGDDDILSWGFSSNAPRLFFRLRMTDAPTEDPSLADFDGDGWNNLQELQMGLDPFNPADAPPVAVSLSLTTKEDTALAIPLAAVWMPPTGTPVTTYEIVTPPSLGQLVLENGAYRYYPHAHLHGQDTFVYKAIREGVEGPAATVSITITPENDPPLVYAGPNGIAFISTPYALQGSVTDVDTDLQDMIIHWRVEQAPAGASATFADDTSLTSTVTFTHSGEYLLRLTAMDGNSRSDLVLIQVQDSASDMQVTWVTPATAVSSVHAGSSVTFEALLDPGSQTPDKVELLLGTALLAEMQPVPDSTPAGLYSHTVSALPYGTHEFTVRIRNTSGVTVLSSVRRLSGTSVGHTTPLTPGNQNGSTSGGDGGYPAGSPHIPNNGGPGGTPQYPNGPGGGSPHSISGDMDGDGISDAEEIALGLDPSNPDTDGDGVHDGEDGVPYDRSLKYPAVPQTRYAVIELGEISLTSPLLGDGGHVVWQTDRDYETAEYAYWSPEDGQTHTIVHEFDYWETAFIPSDIDPDGVLLGDMSNSQTEFAYAPAKWSDPANSAGPSILQLPPYWQANIWGSGWRVLSGTDGQVYASPLNLHISGENPFNSTFPSAKLHHYGNLSSVPTVIAGSSSADWPTYNPPSNWPPDSGRVDFGPAMHRQYAWLSSGSGGAFYHETLTPGRIEGYLDHETWVETYSFIERTDDVQKKINFRSSAGSTQSMGSTITMSHLPTRAIEGPAEAPLLFTGSEVGTNRTALRMGLQDTAWHPLYASSNRSDGITGGGDTRAFGTLLVHHQSQRKLWRNGYVQTLEQMIGAEARDEYKNWRLVEMNRKGLVTAIAKREGTDRVLLLLPIVIDYITRDPETGQFHNLGGTISESDPRPMVELTNVTAQFASNGDLQISVSGTTRDLLAEFLENGNGVSTVSIYLNGELIETISNLSSGVGSVPALSPWQRRDSTKTFNKTIAVSGVTPGVQTLYVVTSANAAGNTGWDTASILISKQQYGDIVYSNDPSVDVILNGDHSTTSIDSITIELAGGASATLDELQGQPASGVFTGQISLGGSSRDVAVKLPSVITLNGSSTDTLDAEITYNHDGRAISIVGDWSETTTASQRFNNSNQVATVESWENLKVDGVSMREDIRHRTFEPAVVRITISEIMEEMLTENGSLKVELNGEEVELKPFNHLVPNDPPPAGMKHFYIAQGEEARTFLAHDSMPAIHYPSEVKAEGLFDIQFKQTNGQQVYQHHQSVLTRIALDETVETSPSFAASNAALNAGYSKEDMLMFFGIIFGRSGENLLEAYIDAGLVLEEPAAFWFGDLRTYRFENIGQRDENEGRTARLRINSGRVKTPVDAAVALFNAVQHLHEKAEGVSALTLRTDLALAEWDQLIDIGDTMAAIDAWQNRNLKALEGVVSGLSEAVKLGMSFNIVGELIVGGVEAEEQLSQGNVADAAIVVGMMLTPEVIEQLFRYMKHGGKSIVLGLPGHIHSTWAADALEPLIEAAKYEKRHERLRVLRSAVKDGIISREQMLALYDSGWLKMKNRRDNLRQNMIDLAGSDPGSKIIAHHDFPVALDLEAYFIAVGLDPNDPLFGRFVPAGIHRQWSSSGIPDGGPFNKTWRNFFDENPEATEAQIIERLNKLRNGEVPGELLDGSEISFRYP